MEQEDEAEKLMTEAFSKNFIDYEEYPKSAEIQNRCVNMIARLFNAREYPFRKTWIHFSFWFSNTLLTKVSVQQRRVKKLPWVLPALVPLKPSC
jgi:Pyridoxal-dependent decarboxylase conserved domain